MFSQSISNIEKNLVEHSDSFLLRASQNCILHAFLRNHLRYFLWKKNTFFVTVFFTLDKKIAIYIYEEFSEVIKTAVDVSMITFLGKMHFPNFFIASRRGTRKVRRSDHRFLASPSKLHSPCPQNHLQDQ